MTAIPQTLLEPDAHQVTLKAYSLKVEPPSFGHAEIRLRTAHVITGVVRDPDGRPVPRASVLYGARFDLPHARPLVREVRRSAELARCVRV